MHWPIHFGVYNRLIETKKMYSKFILNVLAGCSPVQGPGLTSAPNRPYKKPGLSWAGYQARGTLRPGRPNAKCSVDCSQMGIDRSPRAPDHVLSSSSILSIRPPNLRAISQWKTTAGIGGHKNTKE